MAEKKVKLHGIWGSPYTKRVEMALKMKGVEYEYIEEDRRNKSPDLLRYNSVHKKVPVLVHGNRSVAESQVIIEYIDETWDSGTPLLPRDPHQRALARFWARFIDEKLMQSMVNTFWLGHEEASEEIVESLKSLDKELEGKRFFGGEILGFTDIVGVVLGSWIGAIEDAAGVVFLTQTAFPSVWRWREEFVKCGVVKETVPPRDKLAAFLKGRMEETRTLTSK